MTVLRWALVMVSVVVYRVWFPETPPPGPMHLDYHLLVVALIGLYRGTTAGTVAGWAIGFIVAAPDPDLIAWSSLLGAGLGWVMGYWGQRLFMEIVLSRWLVLWLVLLVYRLIYLSLIVGGDGNTWLRSLWTGAFASAGLTATAGAIVSIFWERLRLRTGPQRARISAEERA